MDIIDRLSWYVPLLSIVCVLFLTSINVYIRIRRLFPLTVNCWFCMQNTRVPYDSANSWHCPKCDQYNGFTADGDYNREIPAQRVCKMNSGSSSSSPQTTADSPAAYFGNASSPPTRSAAGNGLCDACNLNQELKVQQLAAFQPDNEADYDREVERYAAQLEQSYRLCVRCDRHLRRRLTRVKRTVLGSKLAQIGARGLRAFDMHIDELNRRRQRSKRRRLWRVCAAALAVLAALNAWRTLDTLTVDRHAIVALLPMAVGRALLVGYALGRTLWTCSRSALSYVTVGAWNRVQTLLGSVAIESGGLPVLLAPGLVVVELVQRTVDQHTETYELAASPERTLCVAALMLCLTIAWLNGFRRSSLATLFVWSLKSVWPAIVERVLATGIDVQPMTFELCRIALDGVVLFASVYDAFARRSPATDADRSTLNASTNSSFHRIYTEADTGEISDDDNETVFSSSTATSGSPSIFRHSRQPTNANGYLRTPPASLNSTMSVSPSAFTPGTLRRPQNSMLTSSIRSLNVSFNGGKAQDFYDHADRPKPSHPSLVGSSLASPAPSKYHSMQSLNTMLYDVPDDFQSGITQLNISDRCFPALQQQQPHHRRPASGVFGGSSFEQLPLMANGPSAAISPARPAHYRSTASIIGPARLLAPRTIHELPSQPQQQPNTSWVAGGYWASGTSPTKRQQQHAVLPMNLLRQPIDEMPVEPMMSRTSSQSSGFESRDNDSRESSVGPSAGPASSSGAAAALAASISPNDSVSQCGLGPSAEPPYRPAFEHFGTHRRFVGQASRPQRPASAAAGKWSSPAAPPFEPGSLLRSWQLRASQADISARN